MAPAGGWGWPCSRPRLPDDRTGGAGRRSVRPSTRTDRGQPRGTLRGNTGGRRGRRVQDPDADRLAIINETGRYISEELTLALAALLRLRQAKGPIVLNLSTSRMTEDLGRHLGCPVMRPVGEINVVERMIAENALLGGEGNGGVIDPRVGFVRDSFVAMAMVLDLLASTGEKLSELVRKLPRYAMIKDQYPLGKCRHDGSMGTPGGRRSRGCGTGSRPSVPKRTAIGATGYG